MQKYVVSDNISNIVKAKKRRILPHSPSLPSTERGGDVQGSLSSPSPFTEKESEREVAGTWRTSPQLWEKLKPLARQKRKEPTKAEMLLWAQLRNHQLSGVHFRRQHCIERFIVDFYCAEANLAVEIDGPIHQYQKEEDSIRQGYLEFYGLHVLRFSNDDVIYRLARVLQQIAEVALINKKTPSA